MTTTMMTKWTEIECYDMLSLAKSVHLFSFYKVVDCCGTFKQFSRLVPSFKYNFIFSLFYVLIVKTFNVKIP